MRWDRFPLVTRSVTAKTWLMIQLNFGLAPNTVEAYCRALEDYLAFCERHGVVPETASQGETAKRRRRRCWRRENSTSTVCSRRLA